MASQPTALIVEDDPDLSTLYACALEAAAFKTERIYDGDDALAHLIDSMPDLIVLDLHLPGMSGLEILRAMRQDARLHDLRVIIATSDARMAAPLEDEVELVLVKPVGFKQLRDLAARFRPAAGM